MVNNPIDVIINFLIGKNGSKGLLRKVRLACQQKSDLILKILRQKILTQKVMLAFHQDRDPNELHHDDAVFCGCIRGVYIDGGGIPTISNCSPGFLLAYLL